MISVILQQAEIIRMLGWSTTNTFHSEDFTDRITSFRIPVKQLARMQKMSQTNLEFRDYINSSFVLCTQQNKSNNIT